MQRPLSAFRRPPLVHRLPPAPRNAAAPADLATPLVAWLATRDAIARAGTATAGQILGLKTARDNVRSELTRAIALDGTSVSEATEEAIARLVDRLSGAPGAAKENLKYLLGVERVDALVAPNTRAPCGDALSFVRHIFCDQCQHVEHDVLLHRKASRRARMVDLDVNMLRAAGCHPLKAFEAYLATGTSYQDSMNCLLLLDENEERVPARTCAEGARVCSKCGAAPKHLWFDDRSELNDLDLLRSPLLVLGTDNSVNESVVRFHNDASRDACELELPDKRCVVYQLVALLQHNGSHFVADVRGDGAGGRVLDATTWVRIDGLHKPNNEALFALASAPILPPTGERGSDGYVPIVTVYCELRGHALHVNSRDMLKQAGMRSIPTPKDGACLYWSLLLALKEAGSLPDETLALDAYERVPRRLPLDDALNHNEFVKSLRGLMRSLRLSAVRVLLAAPLAHIQLVLNEEDFCPTFAQFAASRLRVAPNVAALRTEAGLPADKYIDGTCALGMLEACASLQVHLQIVAV